MLMKFIHSAFTQRFTNDEGDDSSGEILNIGKESLLTNGMDLSGYLVYLWILIFGQSEV